MTKFESAARRVREAVINLKSLRGKNPENGDKYTAEELAEQATAKRELRDAEDELAKIDPYSTLFKSAARKVREAVIRLKSLKDKKPVDGNVYTEEEQKVITAAEELRDAEDELAKTDPDASPIGRLKA